MINWSPMIEEIVDDYQQHLKLNYPNQVSNSFDDLLKKNNEEAAVSEAIIFHWLSQNNLDPKIRENKSLGGTDFICTYNKTINFVVEVSCLERKTINNRGWEITNVVRTKLSGKIRQLNSSNDDMARLVVFTSLHDDAYLNMDTVEAVKFFVSDWGLTYFTNKSREVYPSTDLKESIFFRFDKSNASEIEFCRKSVSALLLIPILGNRLFVTGILHPSPNYEFEARIFPQIPFIKLKSDSFRDGKINTEWIQNQKTFVEDLIPKVQPASYPFYMEKEIEN